MKRLKVDSTLHLPSFCGVPNLLGSTSKDGALAIDTCGGLLYMWTRLGGWDTINVSGGGTSTDTTSLSNRINLKIDSLRRRNDSIFARKNGVFVFQYKDSIGGGTTPSLQQVLDVNATAYNKNLTLIDSGNGYANRSIIEFDLQRFGGDNYMTINDILGYRIAKYSNQYARISSLSSSGGNGKSIQIGWENPTDNFMSLSFSSSDFTNAHKIKSNSGFGTSYTTTIPAVTGTLAMSVNNQTADANGNITISTGGVAVDTIYRTLGKDSIFYKKNNITYAIKDSVGNTSGFVPYTGATSNLNLGTKNITANAYFNGFTSMFAKNDTIVLSIDSTPVHLVKGSGGQGFKLPVATTLANGSIFSFNNNQSSGVINVVSNSIANTLVKSVPSGAYLTLELTDNTTATGTWDAHFQTPSNVSWSTNTLDYNGSITSAQWNGTTVSYNRGGTGQTSNFTQGGVVYGSSTTAMATTSDGTTGQMLVSAGTGTPTWADTTVFQRKSISSYTFLANNTSATANATAQYFKDTSGTYTGTITWNGTAPTSGTFTYRWTRIGKMVNINISLIYAVIGASNSTLTVTLPSDAPTPAKPAGLTSALNQLYPIVGSVNITNASTLTNSATRGFLRNNAANNGFEFVLNYSAPTAANAYITCTYFTD